MQVYLLYMYSISTDTTQYMYQYFLCYFTISVFMLNFMVFMEFMLDFMGF